MAESKRQFQAVKGTRDFYPDIMRVRNWIFDAWRRVSLRNGFEEYDAPIFEYLDLFTVKSGEEIADQLFSLTDRGGRNLAIRPEITPSLARMVAAKINTLPRPIKWFSIPRLCRAERPQRGRLREFFQWNVDVIGVDDIQADAECIYVLVDFLREVGLSPADVQVCLGNRPITVAALKTGGVPAEKIDTALAILDKRAKLNEDALAKMIEAGGLSRESMQLACDLQDCTGIDELAARLGDVDAVVAEELANLRTLLDRLTQMGAGEYCKLDMSIVRGLAYYTGVVYEAIAAGERAVAGGGRYDGLLELVGGPPCNATGFGMGDVVLGILLDEKGKIPDVVRNSSLEFYVVDAAEDMFKTVLDVVGRLRKAGRTAEYSFKRQIIGKQLKEANRRGAAKVLIVCENCVSVKDMQSGKQYDMSLSEFWEKTISL